MEDLAETAARLKRKSSVDAGDGDQQSEGSARSARRLGSARSLSGRSLGSGRNSWASRVARRRSTSTLDPISSTTPRGDDRVSRKISVPSFTDAKSVDDLLETLSNQMSARSLTSARLSARSTGVFSIATPRVAPNATIEKLRATMTQDDIRSHVKERRPSTRTKRLSVVEHADVGCDMICRHTVEESWCPKAVQHHPIYRQYCGSDFVPTRGGDEGEVFDDLHRTKSGSADVAGQRQFGLPHFRDSGYSLDASVDTFADPLVRKNLGLHTATHMKTSIEKMCFRLPKVMIPAAYTKSIITRTLRDLRQCNHVNILRLHEVYEDPQYMYLLFESHPCITLLSVLEEHCWTQEQMVSVVRECCAAFAYASSMNLYHVGLTLSHILLPKTALKDPAVAKVFGFGIIGQLVANDNDVRVWAPSAIDNYKKYKENFVLRMDVKTKIGCDIWSLGAVIYAIVAHRPPVLGNEETLRAHIMAHKWSFPVAFDAIDGEAKALVEQMLNRNESKRIKAKEALHNPWIRRRWQQPNRGRKTFERLEEFCRASLPKKLFGRFLVPYLNAEQLREVSRSFYSLDSQGDGVLCKNDLKLAAAEYAEHPKSALEAIVAWMCPEENTVPLHRFAESFAEAVLDGPVLRSAFEGLDDDGSEAIGPEELFKELHRFDQRLTYEEIVTFMEAAELDVGGGDEGNCLLEFDEFVRLFPERLHRLRLIEERVENEKSASGVYSGQLDSVRDGIRVWMDSMKAKKSVLATLAIDLLGKKGEQYAYDLKEELKAVAHLLSHPPGPATDIAAQFEDPIGKRRKKKKSELAEVYGFDSFMQDHATSAFWPILIDDDKAKLRNAIVKRPGKSDKIDKFAAHDAAQNVLNKIEDVMEWVKLQLEEYESFVEVFELPEQALPTVSIAGRGLPQQSGEKEEETWDEEKILSGGDAEAKPTGPCAACFCQCWNNESST